MEPSGMNEIESTRESTGLWLTPEGYKTLQEELDHLTQVKRPEIAERIRESLQHGEFSEDNSELDEVKFEQAIVETRIAELKTIFGQAQMLEMDTIPTDHASLGGVVKLQDQEFGDDFEIRLVASIEADPNRDLISIESPMGMAILGRLPGDVVDVLAPAGKKVYKVLAISR
jgi:transcription elongation factor GreA